MADSADSYRLYIPDVGGDDEIELVQWSVLPGTGFKKGDELCELVTDKAAFSLEAPQDGVLIEVYAEAGAKVKTGQVVGIARSAE